MTLFWGGGGVQLYRSVEKLDRISNSILCISVISWLSCFIGGVYWENHQPAASLTNFIHNVSSNKGVLIAGIYIHTTVYIKFPRGNGGCSLNLYTQLYVCKYQQRKRSLWYATHRSMVMHIQKRVFPYYIWILIIYCSFKKREVKLRELWCLMPFLTIFQL
jgi:hypothetical protein